MPESLYTMAHSFPASNGANGIATGDFDRDGHADLAIVYLSTRRVELWKGLGEGRFTAAGALEVGTSPILVVSADFDADGWADLAVLDAIGRVYFYRGGAAGWAHVATQVFPGSCSGIAAGEFNGDGRHDLVVTGTSNRVLFVLLSSANAFQYSQAYYNANTSARLPLVADFDGDGSLDIAAVIGTSVAVWRGGSAYGVPNGTFYAPMIHTAPGGTLRSLAPARVDGDGMTDLLYAVADGIGYLPGRGSFTAPGGAFGPAVFIPQAAADFRDVRAVQADLDGLPDLLAISGSGRSLMAYQSVGSGTFANARAYPAGVAPAVFVVADYSGDGLTDTVIAPGDGSQLSVLFARCDTLPPSRPMSVDPPPGMPETALSYPLPPEPGARVEALWAPGGVPLCDAPGEQTELVGANDHAHGAYFGWRDRRGGASDIYAIRLGPTGRPGPGWLPNGNPVCSAPGEQYSPRIFADDSLGFWLAWIDERSGSPELYVQRLNRDGSAAPGWDADGRRVGPVAQVASTGVWSDLAGGLIAIWEEPAFSPPRFRRVRMDGFGSIVGGVEEGEVIFANTANTYNACEHYFSSLQTAFPVWPFTTVLFHDTRSTFCHHPPCEACWSDHYSQVVMRGEDGAVRFGTSFQHSERRVPASDQRGGLFLSAESNNVWRVGFHGRPSWERPMPFPVRRLEAVGDGYFAVGRTTVDEAERLLRITDGGATAPGWDPAGKSICATCVFDEPDAKLALAPDAGNGALVLWKDRRSGHPDLYASWVREDGSSGWGPNGVAVTNTAANETGVSILGNRKGDAIAFWQDSRNGNSDLWAFRLGVEAPPVSQPVTRRVTHAHADEVPGGALRFTGAAPNPSGRDLAVRFQLPHAGIVHFQVTDIGGRVVVRRSLELSAGNHALPLVVGAALTPGVYLVSLEFAGMALTRRAIVVR